MNPCDAQFATDPDTGLVYLVDATGAVLEGPADPADVSAWSRLSEWLRGYLLDSR